MKKRHSSGSQYEPIIGFCRAVRTGNLIHISGTGPIGTDGKTAGVGDPHAQARRCFSIIQSAVEALGGSIRDVVRTRMFLTRIEDWKAVGDAHGEFFSAIRPAATMVQVARLIDPEWLVEIEADAVVGKVARTGGGKSRRSKKVRGRRR